MPWDELHDPHTSVRSLTTLLRLRESDRCHQAWLRCAEAYCLCVGPAKLFLLVSQTSR